MRVYRAHYHSYSDTRRRLLDDEAEEDEHPHPVGTTEAGRVEEREGGEEATAEDDQRSEVNSPLTADRVHEELAVELLLANAEEE